MRRELRIVVESDEERCISNGLPADPNDWSWMQATLAIRFGVASVKRVRRPRERKWR